MTAAQHLARAAMLYELAAQLMAKRSSLRIANQVFLAWRGAARLQQWAEEHLRAAGGLDFGAALAEERSAWGGRADTAADHPIKRTRRDAQEATDEKARKCGSPSEWEPSLRHLCPGTPTLRPDQVAKLLNVDLRTINRLLRKKPDGRPRLMGLEFNTGDGQRMHRRILRDSAILFWADRANYLPADLLSHLLDVLDHRTDAELLAVVQRANEILRRRA